MRILMSHLLMIVPLAAAAQEPAGAATLVRQAITHGQASGTISGPIADEARRRLNATGTLSLSVQRLYLFQEPDCARVQLAFTQEAALLPGSALPAPFTWTSQMNICADGNPPSVPNRRSK